jgi:threonine-phosphate decarboxylase
LCPADSLYDFGNLHCHCVELAAMNLSHGGRLFAVARQHGWHWQEVLDFSASINPLGASPSVYDALREALPQIVHYPDPHAEELVAALAKAWSIPSEWILAGNGATDLIHLLGCEFAGYDVTLCEPVFGEFHRVFPGARWVPANEPEHWPTDGLTIITRPINPSGEMPSIEAWLGGTEHPVLIDESFIEFTRNSSLIHWITRRPNLMVLRSLTKFYALPGLRVGAIVAEPDRVANWKARRDPWAVNTLAVRAACAALQDCEHSRTTLQTITREREWLTAEIRSLRGVTVGESHANFLLVRLPYKSSGLAGHFEHHKILVRDCSGWPGLPPGEFIRVAVRTRTENERLVAAWKEYRCDSCSH